MKELERVMKENDRQIRVLRWRMAMEVSKVVNRLCIPCDLRLGRLESVAAAVSVFTREEQADAFGAMIEALPVRPALRAWGRVLGAKPLRWYTPTERYRRQLLRLIENRREQHRKSFEGTGFAGTFPPS